MNDRSLATSADYADALLVARKAKNLLFLLALLMLLVQIGLFFVARYSDLIATGPAAPAAVTTPLTTPIIPPATTAATTAPAPAEATPADPAVPAEAAPAEPAAPAVPPARDFLQYVSGIVLFLGTILPILLALVLLLIVNIMLVGRLIGLTSLTSAFIWCLLLILLMFPWQIFFGASTDPFDFRLPGVLYTWNDLRAHARFDASNFHLAVVKWARFVAMPAVATVLLMVVQIKSNRGLRQALGEAPVEDIQISV